MSIQCPRCNIAMAVTRTTPLGAPHAIEVDHCEQCGGHWLDAGEAQHVAPFFAGLEARHFEIRCTGTKGGSFSCLRCAAPTMGFHLLTIAIDFCTACMGLWVDGVDAAETVDMAEGRVSSGAIYRTVQRAQTLETVACAICETVVPTDKTYMAGAGLICQRCFHAIERGKQDARAGISDDPEQPLKASLEHSPEVLQFSIVVDGLRRLLATTHDAIFGSGAADPNSL